MRVLLFGARGWIGGQLERWMRARGWEVVTAESRADAPEAAAAEIDNVAPDRVVCAVGRTFGPGCNTVDYLEMPGKLVDNLRDNLFGPLVLAKLCGTRRIHYTYCGTGCLFHDDWAPDARDTSGATLATGGFTEASWPNFTGSSYSTVKGVTDRLMALSEGVLNVRFRMPITEERSPRSFIWKIVQYPKILSVGNSMSVMPTLLPALLDMIERADQGTVHLMNPGSMTHDEVLTLYKEIVDPSHTWTLIDEATHDAMLAAKRSVTVLNTAKIEALCPEVPPLREAVRQCLELMKEGRAWPVPGWAEF